MIRMIKLTNAKNNRRLNEFDDFKEYVIQKNIDVKKIKNQETIGEKILPLKFNQIADNGNEKMLFYFF
ncbi:TPA: hypothetical protein HA246_01610 [Candidatus Woesearchaeota archaeon]|nr:hypothetical protein [Candidatus Woesearchaeota archaeon]